MKPTPKSYPYLLLLALWALTACAVETSPLDSDGNNLENSDPSFDIRGTLLSPAGRPVSGITLTLKGVYGTSYSEWSNTIQNDLQSNDAGYFRFKDVPALPDIRYRVVYEDLRSAEAQGGTSYKKDSITFDLSNGIMTSELWDADLKCINLTIDLK